MKTRERIYRRNLILFCRFIFCFLRGPTGNARQSASDWLYSRTVMTKWLNYDPVVIHANSWRLLQPGGCSIIGGQRRRFSFLALLLCRATTRRRNETFFLFFCPPLRAARSELEHRRDAVIARKPPGLLFFCPLAFGSRINLRYRGIALDPRVRQFPLLFTLDRLISAETTMLRAHGRKVILSVMICHQHMYT